MTLKTDIEAAAPASPALASALTAKNTQAITDAYNALGVRKRKTPVPMNKLAGWMAPTIRGKLQDHANNAASSVRSIALSALDLMRGSISPTFDTVLYEPLLDALVAAGIATPAEKAELMAMADVPDSVTEIDVRRAFWADNGTWLGA